MAALQRKLKDLDAPGIYLAVFCLKVQLRWQKCIQGAHKSAIGHNLTVKVYMYPLSLSPSTVEDILYNMFISHCCLIENCTISLLKSKKDMIIYTYN